MGRKKNDLFRQVIWFDKKVKFDIDFFEYLQPQRIVSENTRYKTGTYYSGKCDRMVQYESGLELSFIEQLEEIGEVKFYFDQPVQIPYWRGRCKQTYTPDFGIYLQTGEFIIAEIKDLPGMLDHRVQLKAEALAGFCAEKGFGLLLTDGKHTIDKLKKIKINRRLEKEILSYLERSVLRKRDCLDILKQTGSTQNELLKVIIKHNLKYKPFPFKLQYNNKNEIFRRVFINKERYDDIVTEYYAGIFQRFATGNKTSG